MSALKIIAVGAALFCVATCAPIALALIGMAFYATEHK